MSNAKLKVVLTIKLPDAVETRMRELFNTTLWLDLSPMPRDDTRISSDFAPALRVTAETGVQSAFAKTCRASAVTVLLCRVPVRG